MKTYVFPWDFKEYLEDMAIARAIRRKLIKRALARAVERQEMHRQNALAYLNAADAALREERRLRKELYDISYPIPRELFK